MSSKCVTLTERECELLLRAIYVERNVYAYDDSLEEMNKINAECEIIRQKLLARK
jgi:hypothetical protein